MGFKVEVTEASRIFELAEREPSIRRIDNEDTWVRTFNEEGDEVEVIVKGLTPQRIAKHLAPTLPINPIDYQPSAAVNLLVTMIIDARPKPDTVWHNDSDRRDHVMQTHGYAMALRRLVELETGITDPDDLDGLCADLISDTEANRA